MATNLRAPPSVLCAGARSHGGTASSGQRVTLVPRERRRPGCSSAALGQCRSRCRSPAVVGRPPAMRDVARAAAHPYYGGASSHRLAWPPPNVQRRRGGDKSATFLPPALTTRSPSPSPPQTDTLPRVPATSQSSWMSASVMVLSSSSSCFIFWPVERRSSPAVSGSLDTDASSAFHASRVWATASWASLKSSSVAQNRAQRRHGGGGGRRWETARATPTPE